MDRFPSNDIFNSSKGMNFDDFEKMQNKLLGLARDDDSDDDDQTPAVFKPADMFKNKSANKTLDMSKLPKVEKQSTMSYE